MTCEKLPMTETPDYVAELKPSAIFIWEFKGVQKRLVGSLDRIPAIERDIYGFIEVMNGGSNER
jgi:hypothetical protein